MQKVAYSNWEAEFQYKDFEKNDSKWVIQSPSLTKSGEVFLTAESLFLELSFELLGGGIHLDGLLNHPEIQLQKISHFSRRRSEGKKEKKPHRVQKIGFFHVGGSLEVPEGALVGEDGATSLFFQMKGEWDEAVHLFFRTKQSLPTSSLNHISLIYTKDANGGSLDFECNELDCSLVKQFLNVYWPEIKGWDFSTGTMKGHLKGLLEAFTGHLQFHNLSISNSLLHIDGFLPETDLILSDMYHEFKIVKPAQIEFTDTLFNGSVDRLLGGISMAKNQPAKVVFEGNFMQNQQVYPVRAVAQVNPEKIKEELFHLQILAQNSSFPVSLSLSSYDSPKGMQLNGVVDIASEPIYFTCDVETSSSVPKSREGSWVPWALAINDLSIQNGRFQAHGINTSDLSSKLLNRWKFSGYVDLCGEFDSKKIAAQLNLKNGFLEHPEFIFELDREGVVPAVYYFDLLSGKHGGSLILKQGAFKHKPSAFSLSDISGTVLLNKHSILIADLQLFANEMFLVGGLEASSLHNGHFSVNLYGDRFHGNATQLNRLLKSIGIFYKPLDNMFGELNLKHQGAFLAFDLSPDGIDQLKIRVEGELFDGKFDTPSLDLIVQDFSCKYKYEDGRLDVIDLFGTMLLAGADFHFIGDRITTDLKNKVAFDLSLGDKNKDILHLVGESNPIGSDQFEIKLDPSKTHFGAIYPEKCLFIFHDDWNLAKTDFLARVDLNLLQKELRNFEQFKFSKNLSGSAELSVFYNENFGQLGVKITSPEIVYENRSYKNLSLIGNKKADSWVLEHCALDDISISGDFTKQKDGWKINFFGLEKADSLLAGLEGFYNPAENSLTGHFNLLTINLDLFKNYLPEVSGKVKSTGMFQLKKKENGSRWLFEADLNSDFSHLAIQNIHFEQLEDVKSRLTNRDITFFASKGSIPELKTEFSFDRLYYEFDKKLLDVKQCQFKMPYEAFSRFSEQLSNLLKGFKNTLEGTFDLALSPNRYNFDLKLVPNSYQTDRYLFDFNQFALNLDPLEIKLEAAGEYRNIPFTFAYRGAWPLLDTGSCSIGYLANDPLNIYWHQNQIKKIEGSLPGIHANLIASTDDLEGEIRIDMKEVKPLLPEKAFLLFDRYGIDGFLSLRGKFNNQAAFNGTCEIKDLRICESALDYATAKVNADPEKINIENLYISDLSGTITSQKISLDLSNPDQIRIDMPEIVGANLKLAHLKKNDSPFTIKRFEFNEVQGDLLNIRSLSGTGKADCTNDYHRNMSNTFINISEDQLAPIGLNLAMLTPIYGTIYFKLQEGLCLLTKLKDVYSAGKLTRFYLSKEKESHIDLEKGILHIFLKMKQHSVLMKLVELFTISIEGTIDRPQFNLRSNEV